MVYVLVVAALVAGASAIAGATSESAARWLEREFREARLLRLALAGLGTLLTACAVVIAVTSGPIRDVGLGVLAVTTGLLALVGIAAPYLRRTPAVTLRGRRILAIGAHPDDLELACGATLAKLIDEGHEVRTVVMSYGASGGDGAVRSIEAQNGSRYLRVAHTTVHDFEDTALERYELLMVAAIEQAIAEFRPDVVLTHSHHDQHQDHDAVYAATLRAARRCSSILCYESPSATRDFSPDFFVDVTSHIDVKVHAIELHRDQRLKPYMTGSRTRATAAFRGSQARVPFAEGFEVVRLEGSNVGDF